MSASLERAAHRLLGLFLLACACSTAPTPARAEGGGFDPKGAAKNLAVQPILTTVHERDGEDPEKMLQLPTREKVEQPYQDTPFVVHVPFEVPYDGGAVRVHFSCRFRMRGEAHRDVWHDRMVAPCYGLYRADGETPAADGVLEQRGFAGDPADWKPAAFDSEGPVPAWVRGRLRIARAGSEHLPFMSPDGAGASQDCSLERDDQFVLSPAKSGRWVLWFSVDQNEPGLWPADPGCEALEPTFYVDVLVSRGATEPTGAEVAHIFHGKPRPEGMREVERFVALSFEIPVRVIRDGWVFDHAVLRVADKRLEEKPFKLDGEYPTELGISTKAAVTSELGLTSTVRSEASSSRSAEILVKDDFHWDVRLPQILPDFGFTTIEIGGGRERYANTAHAQFARLTPEDWEHYFWFCGWDPTFREDAGSYLTAEEQETLLESEDSCEYARRLTWTTRARGSAQRNEDEERAAFLEEFGEAAAPHFFLDERVAGDVPITVPLIQKKGDAPHRCLLYAFPPARRARIVGRGEPYPLLACDVGPWVVIGFYNRLKDAREAAAVPVTRGTVPLVSDEDPFFEWLVGYCREVRKTHELVGDSLKFAQVAQVPLRLLVESNKRLIGYAQVGDDPAAQGEVALDAATRARVMAVVHDQADRIRDLRDQLDEVTRTGQDALAKLLQSIEEAERRWRDRYPPLGKYRDIVRGQYEQLPLRIAERAGDSDALRRAVDLVDPLAASAETRVLQAELLMRDGDMVGALFALRSAVAVAPEDPRAQRMLLELECAFLKAAARKTQGEISTARAAFERYLAERGFKNDGRGQPVGDVGDLPWYKQLAISLKTMDSEAALAVFTQGAVGSLMAINGQAAMEADKLGAAEKSLVNSYLGLNALLRLRMKGLTLERIQKLSPDELRMELPLRKMDGSAYNLDEAMQLCMAIRLALRTLPDIRALFAGDSLDLRLALGKAYNPQEVVDTWIEWIGDLTSVKNLSTLLLPLSVGRVGGRLMGVGLWGAREVAIVQKAEAAGKVLTGSETIAQAIGWGRALQWMGGTRGGQVITAQLERFHKYQETLGLLDQGVWTVGKVMGVMTLQAVTLHLAEKHGGPEAAAVAEAVLLFGADTDLLLKFLHRAKLPSKQVAQVVRLHALPAIASQKQAIAEVRLASEELESLLRRARDGKPITPAELFRLEEKFGDDWMRHVPGPSPSQNAGILVRAGVESAREGIDNGASASVKKLVKDGEEELAELERVQGELEASARKLEQAPGPEPAAGQEPVRAPKPLVSTEPGLTVDALPLGYPTPPTPATGSLVAQGEVAMQKGEFKEAYDLYQAAIDLITHGARREADELPLAYLQGKLEVAAMTRSSFKRPPDARSEPLLRSIDEAEALSAIANKGPQRKKQGKFGVVSDVDGRPDLLIKEVPADRYPLEQAEAEAVHQVLARAVDIDVPGMHISIVRDPGGEVEKAVFVMRNIEGDELATLDVGEIFHVREELARHRALAVLVGDYDRHLGNYMVTPDGRLIPLDAGMGNPIGSYRRGTAIDERTLAGQGGRDHFYSRIAQPGEGGPGGPLFEREQLFWRRQLVAEEALTYQNAKPAVDALVDLVQNRSGELEKQLRAALAPLYGGDAALLERKLAEAMARLRVRSGRLDEVMRGLNGRNGVPVSRVQVPARNRAYEQLAVAAGRMAA